MTQYARFDTELSVRPDDIDMNNHVHTSRYVDYYLAARYDQMERCYKMPMEEFLNKGWTWYIKSIKIDFKRPILMTDRIVVRTWLEDFTRSEVRVGFQILKKQGMKLAAEGQVVNVMVTMATGRPLEIPESVVAQYTQFTQESRSGDQRVHP